MYPVSSENLRNFLGQIKNAGLSERIFSWRRIRLQGEIAGAEYEQLTSRIRELEQETETRKGELVRLEEELRVAAETHDKEIRKLNLFTSVTRHDVLNQLVIIDGYLSLTEVKVSDPQIALYISKQREAVQKIQQQINIRSYQDIGVHRPSWQNVRECFGKTVANIGSHEVSVAMNCPPDLEILADTMLVKVFDALMDNSLRHGERVKTIRISSHNNEGGLVIAWEDDGLGIPADRKDEIFVRLKHCHGFNLFMSREILKITGITIRETGTYGKGARFEMLVPKGAYRFTAQGDSGSG